MNGCGAVLNAGTSSDLTVYFQHVPAGAVDLALWLDQHRAAQVQVLQEGGQLERGPDVIGAAPVTL
jgi:hypothetical protein